MTALEGVNARTMTPGLFPVPPDMAVMDVSCLSRNRSSIPRSPPSCGPAAASSRLVKPQFEAGRAHIGKGGLVKPSDRLTATFFAKLENAAAENGLTLLAQMPSPCAAATATPSSSRFSPASKAGQTKERTETKG